MISVEQAIQIILECTNILGTEKVDILDSLNRVTAQCIISNIDSPLFNSSAMDGYAVIASDTVGATTSNPISLNVVDSIAAGYVSKEVLNNGQAIRIMTGAPVPKGADAVVMIEYVETDNSTVKIFKNVATGENVRIKGEDFKVAEPIIMAGKTLRPYEVAMLTALDENPVVFKRPVVSILSTGDELIQRGEALIPGKIRDTNSSSLYAQVISYGACPKKIGVARDNRKDLHKKIEEGLASDVLILSGGVSVGDFDIVHQILTEFGLETRFWNVAIKPGKPVLFGTIGKTLVFGLPGNPVATMVGFELFIRPALLKMQGKQYFNSNITQAIIDEDFVKKDNRKHYIRGIINEKSGENHVRLVGSQSSASIRSMVDANCLIIIPENSTKVSKGETVMIQRLSE